VLGGKPGGRGWAYLLIAALEIALSRGLHEAVGDVRPRER